MSETVISSQRHLFAIPRDVTYFNCGYLSPQLTVSTDAGVTAAKIKQRPWTVSVEDFFTGPEQARRLFAEVLGCPADDVALTSSVSYGASIAANNLTFEPGQRIVMLAGQFPSNVYPWLSLAKRQQLDVVFLEKPDQTDWTEVILEQLQDPAALVALPNVHWTDGALVDLSPIADRCHQLGAVLALDLTQSVGVMPAEIARLDPDFVFCSAYKWLLGPYGFGCLYVAPRWQQGIPLEEAWINRAGSEDFAALVNYRNEYQAGARRFDMGGRAQFAQWPVMIAALRQITEWGTDNIADSILQISDKIESGAIEMGLAVPSPHAPHLLGIELPDNSPADLLKKLSCENVFVSQRGNRLRIAPYLYNDEEDIRRLLGALRKFLPAA
jgi:selenocysteine lyase/cysteine desulfurase